MLSLTLTNTDESNKCMCVCVCELCQVLFAMSKVSFRLGLCNSHAVLGLSPSCTVQVNNDRSIDLFNHVGQSLSQGTASKSDVVLN